MSLCAVSATETTNPVLDIDLPTAVDCIDGKYRVENRYCYTSCTWLSCRAAQLASQTLMACMLSSSAAYASPAAAAMGWLPSVKRIRP